MTRATRFEAGRMKVGAAHIVTPLFNPQIGSMVAEVMDMVCHTRSHIAYFFPEQEGLDVPLLFAVRCIGARPMFGRRVRGAW
jgi:glyoxylase-like metal-dependent hydrolase (beta-lactamase superfamily II)